MDVFFPLTRQAGGIRIEPCLSGCLFWMSFLDVLFKVKVRISEGYGILELE